MYEKDYKLLPFPQMLRKNALFSYKTRYTQDNICNKANILLLYRVLVALRIILCVIPQTGYIHPDEFFQSIEVMSERYFDIDTYNPWEFNATFPVRTVIFPYLTVGVTYSVMNMFMPSVIYYLGINLKTPYLLVTLPRLFMCFISFVSDYCLYKICLMSNRSYGMRLVIFASSYVTLTYATRTFSNSIESVLLALILYFVSRSMDFSNKVVVQGNNLSKKYHAAENIVDRVKYFKLLSSLPSHSLNDCFVLATIVTAGIFNRPTFVAFAFIPIFFWLRRGLGSRIVGFVDFHIRVLTFAVCTIPTVIAFVIVDSFYFGFLTWGEVGKLHVDINNFVVTPLNFLKYNTNVDNLKEHGLHPKFLHFLVNIPLLFNVLGITGLYVFGKIVYRFSQKQWLKLPSVQSLEGMMMCTFMVPIALLSIFPHQEPRFVIPVLLPLCFICAPIICELSTSNTIVCVIKENTYLNDCTTDRKVERKVGNLQLIWYFCNISLTLFYGFIHQGGILPLTTYLANELKTKPELTHVHLFTSYSYSIPTALLHLRNTKKIYSSSTKHKYKLIQDFYLYEMGSRDMRNVYEKIVWKIRDCEYDFQKKRIPYRIYYAFPASFLNEFEEFMTKCDNVSFSYKTVKAFYPHISTEKLPSTDIWECFAFQHFNHCARELFANATDNFFTYIHQFSLLLVKIEPRGHRNLATTSEVSE